MLDTLLLQLFVFLMYRRTFGNGLMETKACLVLAIIPSGLILSADLLIQLLPSCFNLIIKSLVVVKLA